MMKSFREAYESAKITAYEFTRNAELSANKLHILPIFLPFTTLVGGVFVACIPISHVHCGQVIILSGHQMMVVFIIVNATYLLGQKHGGNRGVYSTGHTDHN